MSVVDHDFRFLRKLMALIIFSAFGLTDAGLKAMLLSLKTRILKGADNEVLDGMEVLSRKFLEISSPELSTGDPEEKFSCGTSPNSTKFSRTARRTFLVITTSLSSDFLRT